MIPEMTDPFKDRKKVKDEIKCAGNGVILEIASLLFAVLGAISEGFDIALWLEPMTWLLLAIVAGVLAIPYYMKSIVARHLYGIESEIKSE
jgi:Flp pilus assembly protein TadB